MNNRLLRFTAVLLAMFIFCTPLFSCAEKAANSTDGSDETIANQSNEQIETTVEEQIECELPEKDFNNAEVGIITRGTSANEWQNYEIYAENMNGELINDAVFVRNARIADKYGIIIKPVWATDVQGQASKAIKAGDGSFDILAPAMSMIPTLQNNGLLYNLKTIPYIDLTKPWWDQRAEEAFTVADKLFYTTGDISISASDATWIMMFNKEIHKELNMENLYDLVTSGKWTLAKYQDLLKGTYKDLNGDTKVGKEDMFGMATHEYSVTGFFYSSENSIAGWDEAGLPKLVMNTPRTINTMEKTVDILGDNNVYSVPVESWADVLDMFQNGRALFYGEVLQCVIRLRQMETNFGVLPYPKFDETQTEYYNFVANAATLYAIPFNSADVEKNGFTLEALAYESTVELTPAYIEKTLKGKHMRDSESNEMLKIILKSRKYDLGYMFDWGGLNQKYMTQTNKKSTDFTSMYEAAEAKATSDLDKFLKIYE